MHASYPNRPLPSLLVIFIKRLPSLLPWIASAALRSHLLRRILAPAKTEARMQILADSLLPSCLLRFLPNVYLVVNILPSRPSSATVSSFPSSSVMRSGLSSFSATIGLSQCGRTGGVFTIFEQAHRLASSPPSSDSRICSLPYSLARH